MNPERSANFRASNAEYALLALLFRYQNLIPEAAKALPPEQFVTDFGRRIYSQFIEINESGQEVSVSLLSQQFSDAETSEIVKIINSDETIVSQDYQKLTEVIKSERFTPKPQDAAKLSSEELLEQMSRLKKKKG